MRCIECRLSERRIFISSVCIQNESFCKHQDTYARLSEMDKQTRDKNHVINVSYGSLQSKWHCTDRCNTNNTAHPARLSALEPGASDDMCLRNWITEVSQWNFFVKCIIVDISTLLAMTLGLHAVWIINQSIKQLDSTFCLLGNRSSNSTTAIPGRYQLVETGRQCQSLLPATKSVTAGWKRTHIPVPAMIQVRY